MTKSLRGIVLAAGACVLAVEYCPVPWSAVFVTAALPFLLLGLQAQRAAATALMINSAAVCCAFGLVEGYLGFQQLRGDGTRMEGSITEGFTRTDDVLGYGPERSVRVTARKLYGNIPLYDVVYTIGDDGLRIAYPANATPISGCIVFFGDSITFGEGVNDDQTFAYLVGQKTAGRYEIYNFGFSGYGPHQMLAALQAGLAEWKVTCQPTHFIYLGWFDHIARVAGLTSWDKHGPRFALDQSGELQRDGVTRKLLYLGEAFRSGAARTARGPHTFSRRSPRVGATDTGPLPQFSISRYPMGWARRRAHAANRVRVEIGEHSRS